MTFVFEELPQGLRSLTSIRKLFIYWKLPKVCFLSSLIVLVLENCNVMTSLHEAMKHNYLKSLRIEGCHSLKFIVGGQLPSSLSKLEIRNCDKLQCLVLMDDMKDTSTASSCSSVMHRERVENTNSSLLEHLSIIRCLSVTCLSSRGQLSAVLKCL